MRQQTKEENVKSSKQMIHFRKRVSSNSFLEQDNRRLGGKASEEKQRFNTVFEIVK